MKAHRFVKKAAFLLIYLCFVFSIIVLADYILYRAYLKRSGIPSAGKEQHLAPFPEVRNVNQKTLLRLGHLVLDRDSSFNKFDIRKKDGVIRIGCFGDSFTLGDEVNKHNDFPRHLQNIFRSRGYPHVEVINFGSSWHGFNQAFILWKYVGKRYKLDYVLLGPGCFQIDRDSTFNHTSGANIYYYHSRYVLTDEHVRLIDVVGKTHVQRMRNYYRYIPHRRYLKYDVQSPHFLRCLLPKSRRLKNPFYYRKGPVREEVFETYRRLLSEMADSGAQIILTNYNQDIVELGRSLKRNSLFSTPLFRPRGFPYVAAKTHNSSFGNRIVAQQIFDILTLQPHLSLTLLKMQDFARDDSRQFQGTMRSLNDYSETGIKAGGHFFGNFIRCGKTNADNEVIESLPSESMVILKHKETDSLNSCFLPLDFDLANGMDVILRVRSKNEDTDFGLGRVELLAPGLKIGRVETDGFEFDYFSKNLSLKGDRLDSHQIRFQKGDAVDIFIDQEKILEGRCMGSENTVNLLPLTQDILVAGIDVNAGMAPEEMDSFGSIELFLRTREGDEVKVPLSKVEKFETEIPYDRVNCRLVPIRN